MHSDKEDMRRPYDTPDELPRILGVSDGIACVFKPAGLPIHPGTPGKESLVDWLKVNTQPQLFPVHRLDAPVSGLVLCAAEKGTRTRLTKLFEARSLTKTYLALVHGRTHKKGIIRKELKDQRRQRMVSAVTRYKLEAWLGKTSLISVRPETGRKHQIRRHLHMIGHGIVGDQRYRTEERGVATSERLWLHAYRLVLPDERQFVCPLPEFLRHQLGQMSLSASEMNRIEKYLRVD